MGHHTKERYNFTNNLFTLLNNHHVSHTGTKPVEYIKIIITSAQKADKVIMNYDRYLEPYGSE